MFSNVFLIEGNGQPTGPREWQSIDQIQFVAWFHSVSEQRFYIFKQFKKSKQYFMTQETEISAYTKSYQNTFTVVCLCIVMATSVLK